MNTSVRRVIRVYVASSALTTLAASIIWGVHTLFLISSGLDIFEVMVVNTVFTFAQLLFEVPTGVVADTLGRKVSFLASIALIGISTLLVLAAGKAGLGITGFIASSIALALGWTFQSGSVEAWLVDELDHVGWLGHKDRVFALGGMSAQVTMFVGTISGGLLGQMDLAWPFYVRSVLLVVCFGLVAFAMEERGFARRHLRLRTFRSEAVTILRDGVAFGWRHRVVRPLLLESAAVGAFFMFGFYSLQPLLLDLMGRDLVWLAAAVTGAGALSGVAGNAIAARLMGAEARPRPTRVMFAASAAMAVAAAGVASVGVLAPAAGGFAPVLLAAVAWMVMTGAMGVMQPVRRSFINAHIPSRQRATVLSFDALFEDAGATAGQPALGWVSRAFSIPVAWMIGSVVVAAALPLYRRAERADAEGGHAGA